MGRILAIDYGARRLGLALSDETRTIAYPLAFLSTKHKDQLIDLITTKEVGEILLGLPQGLSGQDTDMTAEVREFAKWLEEQSGQKVQLIDERFTSQQVGRQLQAEGKSSRESRKLIDSLVARQILEDYLETKRK